MTEADKAQMLREQIAAIVGMLANKMAMRDTKLLAQGPSLEDYGQRLIKLGQELQK